MSSLISFFFFFYCFCKKYNFLVERFLTELIKLKSLLWKLYKFSTFVINFTKQILNIRTKTKMKSKRRKNFFQFKHFINNIPDKVTQMIISEHKMLLFIYYGYGWLVIHSNTYMMHISMMITKMTPDSIFTLGLTL